MNNKRYLHFIIFGILSYGCSRTNTIEVQRRDIIDAVFANGHIASSLEYSVMSKTEGYLSAKSVVEGDLVKQGDRLFEISAQVQDAQLAMAEASYKDALEKLNPNAPEIKQLELQVAQAAEKESLDKKNFERYSVLLETNAVSQIDFENSKLKYESAQKEKVILEQSLKQLKSSLTLNLDNAEKQLRIQRENSSDFSINAAIDGQVHQVTKNLGEFVRRGELLAKIGGGESIIKLFVAEDDINLIQVGQKAFVSLNTDRENVFEVTVSKVYPSFDDQRQSFIIEARFDSLPDPLFIGTQAQANIIVGKTENALVIPTHYLLPGDSVKLSDGKLVSVLIGIRNSEWVEVVSGLEEGTQLISDP